MFFNTNRMKKMCQTIDFRPEVIMSDSEIIFPSFPGIRTRDVHEFTIA